MRPSAASASGLVTRAPGTSNTMIALEVGQAARPISTRQLRRLPDFHLAPINLVVYEGSLGACARDTLS